MIKKIKAKTHQVLRWSEKYTKTDMVYASSGMVWISIGNVISSISSLILTIAFGNLFPIESYGIYQYILSIASILATPTLSGINTAITQSVTAGHDGTVIEGLKAKIRWGLFGGLASLLLAAYYYINGNETLMISFLIVAVFLPFMDSFTVYGSLLEGKKLFKQATFYAVFINISRVVLLITAIFLTQNIFLIIFTYFASTTLLRLIVLLLITKKIPHNNEVDHSAISYGKHLSAMRILGNISSQLDKILLFHYLGPVQVAIYSFALVPATKISSLLMPISSLAMPKFSEKDPAVLKKTLPRKNFYFFLITVAITGIYIILAPFLFKLFLPAYTSSIIYSQIFALSLIFFPQKITATALTAHKQKKALYVITTIGPILKIVSLFVLLPIFGVWGAIASLFAPLIANSLLTTYYFKKI